MRQYRQGRTRPVIVTMATIAMQLIGGGEGRAACTSPRHNAVSVVVEATEPSIRTDYSAADLASLAGTVAQSPPHSILGFYTASIGYRVQFSSLADSECTTISVQLVMLSRVIELAKDLSGDPCRLTAALKHYSHHATIQRIALIESGKRLERALSDFVAAGGRIDGQTDRRAVFEADVHRFLDDWLRDFNESEQALRDAADSPSQIQALADACRT